MALVMASGLFTSSISSRSCGCCRSCRLPAVRTAAYTRYPRGRKAAVRARPLPEEQPVISTVFTVIISSAKAKVPEGIAGAAGAGNFCTVTVCIRGLLFLQQLLNGAADTFDIAGPEALMRAAQGALAVNQVRGGHAA